MTYRTANLQSYILYIYSTNIGTEYFKHGIYSPFFPLQNTVFFHNANVFGSCSIDILYTGCAKIKKNNSGAKRLKTVQRFQSKLLRTIANAPWYVRNQLLRNDLHIPSITEEIRRGATQYNDKKHNHANDSSNSFTITDRQTEDLRRTWPADLVQH